jgi:hypothetical protein
MKQIFHEACDGFPAALALMWIASDAIIFAWRMQWLP